MKTISRRCVLASFQALCSLPLSRADEPKAEPASYNHLTDEQEVAVGKEVAKAIENDSSFRLLENAPLQTYAEDLLRRLVQTSRRPNLPYSVCLVNTAAVNASAIPGGRVYLNRGIIEWAANESQLAAALAHEVGHVAGRHGANNLCRRSSLDSLISEASRMIFGDDLPAQLLKQAGGPLAALAEMRYSRVQEAEADLFGYYNMQRAGWDPRGMVELFDRFGESSSPLDPIFSVLEDHPDPQFRKNQVVAEIRKYPPQSGLIRDRVPFRGAQLLLQAMPKPKE